MPAAELHLLAPTGAPSVYQRQVRIKVSTPQALLY